MLSIQFSKIKIQLYPAVLVLATVMIALNNLEQFFILFLSVTLHELTHIIVAERFGLTPERILITPVGEIAVIKALETLRFAKKMLVIAAGPLSNLALYLIAVVAFPDYAVFKTVNLTLAVFNLLPIYPLDGGRLLQFTLARCSGVLPAHKAVMGLSAVLSKVMIVFGFIQVIFFPYNISLLVIGLYLKQVAKKSYLFMAFEFYKTLTAKNEQIKPGALIPIKAVTADSDTAIREMLYKICWDYYHVFHVLRNGAIQKVITEQALIAYVLENGLSGAAGEVEI